MNKFTATVFNVTSVIAEMVVLNIPWILVSLCGMVVLGVFPASFALLERCQAVLSGEVSSGGTLKAFWAAYRRNFVRANVLGYSVGLLLVVGLIDLRYLLHATGALAEFAAIMIIGTAAMIGIVSPSIATACAENGTITREALKRGATAVVVSPFWSALRALSIAVVCGALYLAPGAAVAVGASMVGFVCLFVGGRTPSIRMRPSLTRRRAWSASMAA